MFGHLVYFNSDKVIEYDAILLGNEIIEYESIEVSNEKTADANAKVFSGGKKSIENYHGKIIKNDMLTCNKFLKNLNDTDCYIDFVDGIIEYDSNYLARGNIIRIESDILIPEKFDVFKLWDTYKDYFNHEFSTSIDEADYKAFGKMLETKELKIPICINIGDNLGCALLTSSLLKCDYESFENLEGEEVIILAKVISPNKSKEKELFNPLTDFLSLNRFLRRKSNVEEKLPTELSKIYVDRNYVLLEVLAIYQ